MMLPEKVAADFNITCWWRTPAHTGQTLSDTHVDRSQRWPARASARCCRPWAGPAPWHQREETGSCDCMRGSHWCPAHRGPGWETRRPAPRSAGSGSWSWPGAQGQRGRAAAVACDWPPPSHWWLSETHTHTRSYRHWVIYTETQNECIHDPLSLTFHLDLAKFFCICSQTDWIILSLCAVSPIILHKENSSSIIHETTCLFIHLSACLFILFMNKNDYSSCFFMNQCSSMNQHTCCKIHVYSWISIFSYEYACFMH